MQVCRVGGAVGSIDLNELSRRQVAFVGTTLSARFVELDIVVLSHGTAALG